MIVVDTNVVAYCYIRFERTQVAQRVRLRDPVWHVPILWRSELRSALAGYIGRGTMKVEEAADIMTAAETALGGCEHVVASPGVLELAARSRLSAYDCEFIALAQSLGVPLVTEDRAVLKAFPDVAMTMEDFLESSPATPPAAHEKRATYRAPRRGQRAAARAR
ncbi:MAG TPA: type II toxin-antitoxin system VapC family toxin [Usitatibacter sp.]|nr:type II toxin-antitoxin system VapC family toxin [Usitatibacter sp.]